MLTFTLHWWLAWWLFCASSAACAETGPIGPRTWFFPARPPAEAGASPLCRWFEAHDSGFRSDSLATLLIEREWPGGNPVARRLTPRLFRLFLVDIDGNGSDDLVAGVERTIRGRRWRRVYVYHGRRPDMPPLWLGSRLSFVLEDFSVATIRGKPGLRAVERHYGRRVSSDYLWYTFGFRTVSSREDTDP